jgi:hypothetical protein
MSIALVASINAGGPGANGGSTAAVDTTGADLIIIGGSWWGFAAGHTAVFSDNKGNTWTLATLQPNGGANDMCHQKAYCFNPTVGSGHTFSVTTAGTGYPGIVVLAFSGTSGYSYQTRNGASTPTTSGSPFSVGSVTPSANNALLVSGLSTATSVPPSLAMTSFTIVSNPGAGGASFNSTLGYYVQPTAAAINPAWTWSGGGAFEIAADVVVFSGAGGGAFNPAWGQVNRVIGAGVVA